jgi:hypothetical protein
MATQTIEKPIPNSPRPKPIIGNTLLPVNASEPSDDVASTAEESALSLESSDTGWVIVSPSTDTPESVPSSAVGVATLPSPSPWSSRVVVVLSTTIVEVEVVDGASVVDVVVVDGATVVDVDVDVDCGTVVLVESIVVGVEPATVVVVDCGTVDVVVESSIVVLVESSTVVVDVCGIVVVVDCGTVVLVESSVVEVVEVDDVVVEQFVDVFIEDMSPAIVVDVVDVEVDVDVDVGQHPAECVEANAGTVRRPTAANRMPALVATMRRVRLRLRDASPTEYITRSKVSRGHYPGLNLMPKFEGASRCTNGQDPSYKSVAGEGDGTLLSIALDARPPYPQLYARTLI